MNYEEMAKIIVGLTKAYIELRNKLILSGQINIGYNEEMKELHNINAIILSGIINKIGYPTTNKVGKEASESAWLVIQHSIEQPDFMKKCLKLLEVVVSKNKVYSKN